MKYNIYLIIQIVYDAPTIQVWRWEKTQEGGWIVLRFSSFSPKLKDTN